MSDKARRDDGPTLTPLETDGHNSWVNIAAVLLLVMDGQKGCYLRNGFYEGAGGAEKVKRLHFMQWLVLSPQEKSVVPIVKQSRANKNHSRALESDPKGIYCGLLSCCFSCFPETNKEAYTMITSRLTMATVHL